MNAEELAIVTEYLVASDAMHEMYGSTAVCFGGAGGQAMTPHCAHVCYNDHAHGRDRERFDNAYRAIRMLIEENR